MSYYFAKKISASFDEAVSLVTAGLKQEGFGVLTEIDVRKTLKEKLDTDFRDYRILGACNPPFAYKALQAVENEELEAIANEVRSKLKRVIDQL